MSAFRYYVAVLALVAVTFAQDYDYQPAPRPAPSRIQPGYSGPAAPRPTPVSILKQINRHNEDGSYTYGYESGDGSFKIETKLPTGEVRGKYGYVDDTGKVRVVEYGATKHGFQPSGEGITVAPPTLVDETTGKDGNFLPEYSGAYFEEPQQQAPASRPRPRPQPQQSFDFGPQQFGPAPQQSHRAGPVPPRAAIPGAAPSQTQVFEFGPSPAAVRHTSAPRNYAPRPSPLASYEPNPAPIEEDFGEPEPAPIRTAPRITYAQPAARPPQPQFAPAPRPAPVQQQYAPQRPQGPSALGGRSGGILDQLSKDYALPAGGAPALHDISFGYY